MKKTRNKRTRIPAKMMGSSSEAAVVSIDAESSTTDAAPDSSIEQSGTYNATEVLSEINSRITEPGGQPDIILLHPVKK